MTTKPTINPLLFRSTTLITITAVDKLQFEPALQPLNGEPLRYATANREDGA